MVTPLPEYWRHHTIRHPGPGDHLPGPAVLDRWWGGLGGEAGSRRRELGAALYERFFAYRAAHGRSVVRAITSPENKGSHAFHTRMGFVTEPGPTDIDGVPVQPGHDGPGLDRLSFRRDLG